VIGDFRQQVDQLAALGCVEGLEEGLGGDNAQPA